MAASVPNIGPTRSIVDLKHPEFIRWAPYWEKWRLTYEAGEKFVWRYLKKFSSREDDRDYERRREVSYVPAMAKSAIDEIKNSIYQRTVDVVRKGGPQSFQLAAEGDTNGVDKLGRSMNSFMGTEVLPELLPMSKVGIYVDMPPIKEDLTLGEFRAVNPRPYVYVYKAEDILSWQYDEGNNPNNFRAVLLRECRWNDDDNFDLPTEITERYRYIFLRNTENGRKVHVQYFNKEGEEEGNLIVLEIDRIPLVVLELDGALLMDAADYQIALLNLASSDLAYCLTANFPFYTEQWDPRTEASHLKKGAQYVSEATDNDFFGNYEVVTESRNEIRVGATAGRRYPATMERPGFIHPSSEPMLASMAKQKELKEDIRLLVGLSLSNIKPKMASAESKTLDTQGLEAGLSYIGLVLQYAERKIAEYWAMYLGSSDVAEITYPEQYSLRSSQDQRDEITQLLTLLEMGGSITLRKRIAKQIATLLVASYVDRVELDNIHEEIDAADVIITNVETAVAMNVAGVLSLKSWGKALGFPDKIVDEAINEHEDRLTRIAKAQTPADPNGTGIRDLGQDPAAGKKQKAAEKDNTTKGTPQDQTRGKGK